MLFRSRDAMGDILKQLPLDLSKKEDAFSKDLLLLIDVYKRQVREMALECVFQKKVEKSKMRPSARRGRAQRKCKKYLDVLTAHTHSRNIPLAEHSFF